MSGVSQSGAYDLVVWELEQMLGGEDQGAVDVAGLEGAEDLGSLTGGTGHAQTLAIGADASLMPGVSAA